MSSVNNVALVAVHHEFDKLAGGGKALLAIIDHVLDQLTIAQRLAAEEHHGEAFFVRRFLGNISTDATAVSMSIFTRRRLVQVFFVAIGTTQVAASGDV